MAYGILATIDLVSAAILFTSGSGVVMIFRGPVIFSLTERGVIFCLIHFLASLFLTFGMTPWGETLYSWVWRFRRRLPFLVDLWLDDRSENVLSLITFAVMGLVSLALFVVLQGVLNPLGSRPGWAGPNDLISFWSVLPTLIAAAIMSTVLILTFGTIHQWVLLIAGRSGTSITFILGFMAALMPLAGGLTKQSEWVMSFSPLRHYAYWLGMTVARNRTPAFSSYVLDLVYLLVFIVFWFLLRGRMRKLEAWVDFKLRMMGALPPLHHDQK